MSLTSSFKHTPETPTHKPSCGIHLFHTLPFYLKGEVRWASKNKIIQATFLPHFVFARAPPCVACEVLHSRRGVRHFTDQCFWEPHLPAAYILLWLFRWCQCLCCDNFDLDSSPLMPPSERDLQLYTITQLIQLLISVGYGLARRFRVALPGEPAQDETQPFHCHEPCNWCTATCIRTCTTHRRHQCARHLGF